MRKGEIFSGDCCPDCGSESFEWTPFAQNVPGTGSFHYSCGFHIKWIRTAYVNTSTVINEYIVIEECRECTVESLIVYEVL